jgi:tellurite methyltransferase
MPHSKILRIICNAIIKIYKTKRRGDFFENLRVSFISNNMNLSEYFGNIDIYLFDQILKGRCNLPMRILDAGCGGGRNIVYFLREGFEVFGTDINPEAIEAVRHLAENIIPNYPSQNFQISTVEKMPFADSYFDLVISSAVLHFADNETHFSQMFDEMWRVLKPNGILFARLASDIGIENLVQKIHNRRFLLPDGSERFLVNETILIDTITKLNGILLEPIKTTNVQNLRCMTTLVLQKK